MTADADALNAFEKAIAEQEDLIYGIALFFEGISLLFSGQNAVLETYRKQFRNVIQAGSTEVEHARELLREARETGKNAAMLQQFAFHPGQGHPDPETLVARARVMVQTYEEQFPGRPRDEALTPDDTMKLISAAADRLELDDTVS